MPVVPVIAEGNMQELEDYCDACSSAYDEK